jgi:hypothetical protein
VTDYDEIYKLNDTKNINSILNIDHDYYFLNKIEEINAILGQRQLENIITTLNIITNRNNHEKIESMKKNNIQKCISWCEKHDIPSIKLSFSNNIFLSNVYEDGTPITVSRGNNSFMKKRNSSCTNYTSNVAAVAAVASVASVATIIKVDTDVPITPIENVIIDNNIAIFEVVTADNADNANSNNADNATI